MMDENRIKVMREKRYTYLGCIEGKEIFCNLENKESVQNCLEYLESITGEEWSTILESNGNHVFYKTSMYVPANKLLICIDKNCEKYELPLNASSCMRLFGGKVFTKQCDFSNWDMQGVCNTSYMFWRCNFAPGFILDLDVSGVDDLKYMFSSAIFPDDFRLGPKFCVRDRVETLGMFDGARLPGGKTRIDFTSNREIIEWLKNRKTESEGIDAF